MGAGQVDMCVRLRSDRVAGATPFSTLLVVGCGGCGECWGCAGWVVGAGELFLLPLSRMSIGQEGIAIYQRVQRTMEAQSGSGSATGNSLSLSLSLILFLSIPV